MADALKAGPSFITKEATLLDWPAMPGGEYRLLRKGTNEWTCLPAIPGYPHEHLPSLARVFLTEPALTEAIRRGITFMEM
jgi:hypothetical protein